MFDNLKDDVFDGLLTAALREYIMIEEKNIPSDREISKMYPKSEKDIKQYRRKIKEKRNNSKIGFVYLRRVAVIFLMASTVSFGLLSTSGKVRAAISDTVEQWFNNYIRIDFSKSSVNQKDASKNGNSENKISDLEILYIPKGFELIDLVEDKNVMTYTYVSQNGEYISISTYVSGVGNASIDIEEVEYEHFKINQYDAYLSYDDDEKSGSLVFGNSDITVYVFGIVSKNEIIKIAENIK